MVNGNASGGFHLDLSGKYLYMKNCILSVIMFLGTLTAFSQQSYFVYLQTDNNQPFYVRLDKKIYSSAASGYLVLAHLPDSIHNLTIGFPRDAFPEQEFAIPQNHKDGGFLLKNFGDKGWGLFNLQTMAVIMSSTDPNQKKSTQVTGVRKNDAFSMLLANAVNDSSILYTVYKPKPQPVVITPEKKDTPAVVINKPAVKTDTASFERDHVFKPDTAKNKVTKNTITAKKDSAAVAKTTNPVKGKTPLPKNKVPLKKVPVTVTKNNDSTKNIVAAPTNVVKKDTTPPVQEVKTIAPVIKTPLTNVTKAAELRTDTSYIAVFIDEAKEKNDTIRISIPFENAFVKAPRNPYQQHPANENKPSKDSMQVAKPVEKENKFLRIDTTSQPVTINEPVKKDPPVTTPLVTTPAAKDSTTHVAVKPNSEPVSVVKKDSAVTTTGTDTSRGNLGLKPILINSDCKNTAWDSDIDKLRIKMLAANSDDDKIDLAKKVFRQKCFTVKQIRALSELFTTDQAKYKWLDAVYPYTTNSYYFSELEDLIKDEYFKNRFKAMIRKS